MASEWAKLTLEEVCSVITDGAHFSPKDDPLGLPMASVKDLTRHGIELHGCRRISQKDFDSLKRQGCSPKYGDVLIAKDGNSALDTVCVHQLEEEVVLLSSVAILRPNEKVTSGFLRYYLDSPETRNMLKSGFRSGSAIPRVVLKDFRRAPIVIPSINEQQVIAHILGTLDDKIELNRRMSETLEGMARALFKSWFVDFDPVRAKAAGRDPALPKEIAALFPSRLVKSELGEIPEGWAVKPFLETVDVIGGGTPKTSEPEYWDGEIPWFSVVDAPSYSDIWVVNTEKKITQKGVEASSTKVLPVGTTIISARGTVGKVALVGTPMAMNQSCYGLRGKQDVKGIFNYFSTRALIGILQQHAHGSVFDTITRDTLAKVPVALPMELLVNKFESLVGPLVDRVLRNVHESRTLAALRDALLPKIISGELRVRNEEKVAARRSA